MLKSRGLPLITLTNEIFYFCHCGGSYKKYSDLVNMNIPEKETMIFIGPISKDESLLLVK